MLLKSLLSWLFVFLHIAFVQGDNTLTHTCVQQALYPRASECEYPPITSSQTLIELRDKWIIFMGESTLRQIYLQLIGIIDNTPWDDVQDNKKKETWEIRRSGSRFTFHYRPYFANLSTQILAPLKLVDGRKPDLLILNDGLHDLLYSHEHMDTAWNSFVEVLKKRVEHDSTPILWIPPSFIYDEYLTGYRKEATWFRNETIKKTVEMQYNTLKDIPNVYFYNIFRCVNITKYTNNFDGLHNMYRAREEANGFVGTLHSFNKDKAVWATYHITPGQIMCFLCYIAILIICLSGELATYKFFITTHRMSESTGGAKNDEIAIDTEETKSLLANSADESNANGMIEMSPVVITNTNAISDAKINTDSVAYKSGHRPSHTTNTNIALVDYHKNSKEDHTNTNLNPPNNTSGNNASDNSTKPSRVKPVSKADPNELRYLSLPPMLDRPSIRHLIEYYDDNFRVFRAMFGIAICLMIVYLADGPTHLFPPTLKHYHRDFFMFLHVIFLVVAAITFKRDAAETKAAILSRAQTEEWKGIMQIVFVMYHYYDAAEVYNMIRIFIAAYVWMTGFGNTQFFLSKKIFNATRFFSMMFRLNFLVFWVCLLLNQPLMLYYICPMHTFYFIMCYATWGIFYTKNDLRSVIAAKMIGCFLFLAVMFEIPGVFEKIWAPFYWLLQYHGSLYEWQFRSALDHYATWLGMLFALFYDRISKTLVALEAQTTWHQVRNKGIIIALTLGILYIWYDKVYSLEKLEYNAIHPYTSFVPIFSYILLRNIINKVSREYASKFLEWMGKITLETYIFQYHIFMIDDAKSILTVFVDYPLMNFVVVSAVYILLSKVTFDSTDVLRDWFYPTANNPSNILVFKRTTTYALVLLAIYTVSYVVWLFTQ